MKRGFLNTVRPKRVIEEAYAPQSPPSGRRKPPVRSSPRLAQKSFQTRPNSNDAATGTLEDDAMDVDRVAETPAVTSVLQEVYADGQVVAVRVTQSTDSEGKGVTSAQDTAVIERTRLQEVYADGHVVAVRVVRPTVSEAKTPPKSRKDDHGTPATSKPHRASKDPKGKGKAKAVSIDDDDATDTSGRDNPSVASHPQRLLQRNPPGWGRHPDEEFFHTVPASHDSPHTKRAVFRLWPRDPIGRLILPSVNPKGTLSPDGYPWGATLYDFYHVNMLPQVPGMMSVMTGSAILEAVETLGELDVAAPEIEWARSEGKPRVEGAADTEELIKCQERRLHGSSLFPCLKREQDGEQDEEDAAKQAPREGDADATIPPPPTMPGTSFSDPSHGPKRSGFIPFENRQSILLQERIPLYLLPQTLHVHDPFCLLDARRRIFNNTSWTSRPDVVRTYNLHLSGPARWKSEDERRKAEELEKFKARTLIILRYQRTKDQIRNHEPIIEVPLPPYSRRPTTVEESHLYLSPVAKVGEGHHSIVYRSEWELPRDIFVKHRVCSLCFKESVDKEVQRLKDTGRWEKMLKAGSWGPTGFTGRQPTQAELDDVNDLPRLETDGEIIEREITCVVPPDADPSEIVQMIDETNIWDELMEQKQGNAALLYFTGGDGEDESTKDSRVAVVRINPPFPHESQKPCVHDCLPSPVPRTAIFTVVAKLSLEDDPHLNREASNYQRFPERLFEHYNGYTMISQLHTIVPVHAVAPQFYGYYVPGTSKTKGKTANEPSYLSPILLLEHCGEPIYPEELSSEDQEECVSMLLRFQRAGWLHESVAPRNFLVQRGKPTEFPLVRQVKPELSFRLIDFGRSRKYDNADEKRMEEIAALEMFGTLNGKMAVTFGL